MPALPHHALRRLKIPNMLIDDPVYPLHRDDPNTENLNAENPNDLALGGTAAVQGIRYQAKQMQIEQDTVVEELPVSLVYNGISHVVMLMSPVKLREFAIGFSLSEGILKDIQQLYELDIVEHANGIEIRMQIASQAFSVLKESKRGLAGRSGCGLCGVESLQQLALDVPLINHPFRPTWLQHIPPALKALPALQPITQATGGAHAAAWVSGSGELLAVFEDVGRHNALDKLLGHLALQHADFKQGFVLITSRASYELVRKCAYFNVALLASISAPTSLAIRLADQAGLALASFCRDDGFVLYSGKKNP